MTDQTIQQDSKVEKPIRVLPGIVILIVLLLIRYGLPIIVENAIAANISMALGMLGGLVILVWWAFFSRISRMERWGGLGLVVLSLLGTVLLLDKSIQTGMMGMMYFMYVMPGLSTVLVGWAVVARYLSVLPRRVLLSVLVVVACGYWALLQSAGIVGAGGAMLSWRWMPTAEELLLVETQNEEMSDVIEEQNTELSWPGFRGPNRDSIIYGTSISPDWSTSPPRQLWARKIGPGCSSFAVKGSLLYTQEQRGKYEMVTCYNLHTGKPVWQYKDKERFYDSHAGAGPRSTPTLYKGQVFTFGPTGILNALHAKDGSKIWSRQVGVENKVKLPIWALTSSPLVKDDLVIIAVEGLLIAFDRATGDERWRGPHGGKSYSSPHLVTLEGIEQVLQIGATGVISVAPYDGKVLWEYKWEKGEPIVQPAVMDDGDLLITTGEGFGLIRMAVKLNSNGWMIEEKWKSSDIQPSFNDIVVHKNHVYGFSAPVMSCVDLTDGKMKWQGGKYGGGQLMLLADQDLLIVISEKGELALVKATPDDHTELSRLSAIEGRVWNHPVLVNDILLLRNSQEMIAYQLALL